MTTDSQWHSNWRSETHYQGQYLDKALPQWTPTSNTGSHNVSIPPSSAQSYSEPLGCMSQGGTGHHASGGPSMIDRYADASTYHSRFQERHSIPARDSSLTRSPSGQNQMQPWQSLPADHSTHQRNMAEGSLTLHIPQAQDIPKLSTTYTPGSTYPLQSQGARQHQQQTSLPSFASLSEHANRTGEPDEMEIAPMSARLSCHSCNQLTPLLRDVALAVAELDDYAQQMSNKVFTRSPNLPKDDPVRAAQWVLECLFKTKLNLQETALRLRSGTYYSHQPASNIGKSTGIGSPTTGLKRSADHRDQDDLPAPKRTHNGILLNELSRTASNNGPVQDRMVSIDFSARSPPPTESVPGSAYPRTGSPGFLTRPQRTLPSPSSIAYPPSAAPSLVPATAPSIGSPSTSYLPAVSIHTASASSATSAHIADLQHQVTLKSLSLQTLQSEYASLLQKLQREKVKSQTIEKKTSVADQEVNELTGRNEDLVEQVKALEMQLEESEKKREHERLTASAERDQWTKLLAMDRQLQSRNAEEKQKLREEKMLLSQRVAAFEGGDASTSSELTRPITSRTDHERLEIDGEAVCKEPPPLITTGGLFGDADDVSTLKNEIRVLNSRIEALRSTLEEAKRRAQSLHEHNIEKHAEISTSINRALTEHSITKTMGPAPEPPVLALSEQITPAPPKTSWNSAIDGSTIYPNSSRTWLRSPNMQKSSNTMPPTMSSLTLMASIGRAVSPGPDELGFHVTPSTSSPEELISALGPVPAPAPVLQFDPAYGSSKRTANNPQRKKPRKQNPEILTAEKSMDTIQFGSFRPSSYHMPAADASMSRTTVYKDSSVPSYVSSPASATTGSSPSSSGSDGRRSYDEEKTGGHIFNAARSTFATILPPTEVATEVCKTNSMAPPPRPSMSLKDLCALPTGQTHIP